MLNPSINGTKPMLKICEEYALQHKIMFNAKKREIMIVGKHKSDQVKANLCICDEPIPYVDQVKYLGHIFSNTMQGYFE